MTDVEPAEPRDEPAPAPMAWPGLHADTADDGQREAPPAAFPADGFPDDVPADPIPEDPLGLFGMGGDDDGDNRRRRRSRRSRG